MNFQDISKKTIEICKQFPQQFDKKDTLIHLMETVGELSNALLLVEGRKHSNRPDKQMTEKDISKRLGALLMYIFLLAQKYDINLESDYLTLLNKMQERINSGEFDK